MEVKLDVIKGPERGRSFTFAQPDTFLVGRSGQDAHLRLSDDDPYVSRRHFLLEIAPPRVFFKELTPTNPTRINGLFKQEEELHDGDVIEVGYTQLKVSISEHIEQRTVHCQRCRAAIPVLGDEKPADHCAECERAIAAAEAKKYRPDGPLTLCCHECGADLTARANSDGRAAELGDRVTYLCASCRPRDGENGGGNIGPYHVIKGLGEGGMGQVFLVYHSTTARLLALKQMNIDNPLLARRFERETRIMENVRHKHVLAYVDAGLEGGKPYLVMEYADCGDLDKLAARHRGCLPVRQAVTYFIGVLEGLEQVHRQGIVHRDIKPVNILLRFSTTHGTGTGLPVPKLADFGISREFSRAGGTVLTQLGIGMGTILYMPPEQIKDTHSVREPADLYAVGVSLYQVLTGRYPFKYPTPAEVNEFWMQNRPAIPSPEAALKHIVKRDGLKPTPLIVLTEEPIAIRERRPDIPEPLARVVDKAIRKAISERFQSAAEFREQLQAAAQRL